MCALGTITSDIGIITGLGISDIVSQLMQIEQKPRDLLQTRTDKLTTQRSAITQLTALLYSIKYVSGNLGKTALFNKTAVTSSMPGILSATQTGSPAAGTYTFTAVRKAQNHQFLSGGFASDQEALGGGTVTLRYGENVLRTTPLTTLLGGAVFPRGKIRITDHSGAQAEVDLTSVQTIEDVLSAINNTSGVNVQAEAVGDHIRLIDYTGQTASPLMVQEIGAGTTAAALGLAGINVAEGNADGQDIVKLQSSTFLGDLNDGRGTYFSDVLPDVQYTLRDGTVGQIDLDVLESGGSTVIYERTLGDVLEKINAAAPGKLHAEIAPDGKRLVLTDLTAGENDFQLQALHGSHALDDLGLNRTAENGVITGRRLLGGLQSVLLTSLNGGKGLGPLGLLEITDRSGQPASVDLSTAETLEDVVHAINGAGLSVEARVNAAKNGIEVLDTSGADDHNLTIASGDATETAEKLMLAVDDDVSAVNSGDLHFQVVGYNTKLSTLNGGRGVASGKFTITDSRGNTELVNLKNQQIQTVGDLLEMINALSLDVEADLNDTGDGLLLRDLSGGEGNLKVAEDGSTTAKDLNLLGEAVEVEVGEETVQVIDGAMAQTVTLEAGDSLQTLRDKINQLQWGVTASIISDGSSQPYHLMLSGNGTGRLNQIQIDASATPVAFEEMTRPQDALLLIGSGSTGLLASSSTNAFTDVLPGVTINLLGVSSQPVTVQVAPSNTDLKASVKTLVDNYNSFRAKLKEYTAYDLESNTRSALNGDSAALRLDTDLSRFLSGTFFGAGKINSLAQLGVSFKDDGSLAFDESKLDNLLQSDRDAVNEFFTTTKTGFSERFSNLIEQLSGSGDSLLDQKIKSLQAIIDGNNQRISAMESRLKNQSERLLMQFYNMESAIARLQNNLNALQTIQWITDSSNSQNQLFD
ncbi:MAG: flagellar filament capping protein FliD [Pirellulales bacterium]|nr:flagellar filament capping protein FliD [Pirellulales bacterium]